METQEELPRRGTANRGLRRLPSYRARALHLTAVWAYGVSQPIFSIVDGNQEILVAHGATRIDAMLVVTTLAVAPPLLGLGYVWAASRVSRWVGDVLYLVILGAYLIPLALQLVKLVESAAAVALLAVLALCVSGVGLYLRFHAVRMFVGFSIVLPIVGVAIFVRGMAPVTGEAQAVAPSPILSPHPVVVVVFDEFPASSLMTTDGRVDTIRYPNFARLAREGTWYVNAVTPSSWTQAAVPALVTGRVARVPRKLPLAFNYPDNLFALLGDTYDMSVHEESTRLCPRRHCPVDEVAIVDKLRALTVEIGGLYAYRVTPGSIVEMLQHRDRDSFLDRELIHRADATLRDLSATLAKVRSIRDSRTLVYEHLLLPHRPWQFFPSGVVYDGVDVGGLAGRNVWTDEAWLVAQAYQRHLLQVGFTDRVLGRLLARLDEERVFDDALIVVAGDHGASFRPGGSHRWPDDDNVADIANVPLFVKYPNQRSGGTDARHASLIDVVPTIADVLGMRLAHGVEGTSLRGPLPSRSHVEVIGRGGRVVRASWAEILASRDAVIRSKESLFGKGGDSLFRLGEDRDLLGARVSAARVESGSVRIRVESPEPFRHLDEQYDITPARVIGVVVEGDVQPGRELAIAVNGRVRALTRCRLEDGKQVFEALVPEGSVTGARNRVDVFLVEDGNGSGFVWAGSNVRTPKEDASPGPADLDDRPVDGPP